MKRGSIAGIPLDNTLAYYIVVGAIALCVLHVLLRIVRSPFGHVLVAIRENQQRAAFQGYRIEHYKLAVFVISAVVTGLAGALPGSARPPDESTTSPGNTATDWPSRDRDARPESQTR